MADDMRYVVLTVILFPIVIITSVAAVLFFARLTADLYVYIIFRPFGKDCFKDADNLFYDSYIPFCKKMLPNLINNAFNKKPKK